MLLTGVVVGIKEVAGGSFYYRGLSHNLHQLFQMRYSEEVHSLNTDVLSIQINVDGLPLFKSSSNSLWPILGLLPQFDKCSPFVIGLFCGGKKPNSLKDYLSDFVAELLELQQSGFEYNGKKYKIEICSFVCDAPARQFLKNIKSHNGYFACEKCVTEGEHDGTRMSFPETNASLRTDESFQAMTDDAHHQGLSPLSDLLVGMVSQFPLDYMHLVCLGVMKRLIGLWMNSKASAVRLSSRTINDISDAHTSLNKCVPQEFARKPRSLLECSRWKATEFRQFLLYTGPLCLYGRLPDAMYSNFLLLSVAIRILASPVLSQELNSYAEILLKHFVQHFAALYGGNMVSYNVHSVIHLPADVRRHGPVDDFSAFPFENFLGQMKKMVRQPKNAVQQVVLRLDEMSRFEEPCKPPRIYPDLQMIHFDGPHPSGNSFIAYSQYKRAALKNFSISVKAPDNCIKIGSLPAIVRNIIHCRKGVFVMYSLFHDSGLFFTYPCDSVKLGVQVVSNVCDEICVASIDQVELKYVMLPHNDGYVIYPLLHTSES